MNTDLMIECLQIALAQKQRKANTFKVGSAARAEIDGEAGIVQGEIIRLQTGGKQLDLDTKKNK